MTTMTTNEAVQMLLNSTDEAFAEFFVCLYESWKNECDANEIELTQETMRNASSIEIANWIRDCLHEILWDGECCQSAWWKGE